MNIRCLLGHAWRELPWFKPRDNKAWSNPKKICIRCFKTWRPKYSFVIDTVEGHGWSYYLGPHWEGQSPPNGYTSWKEYHATIRATISKLWNRSK